MRAILAAAMAIVVVCGIGYGAVSQEQAMPVVGRWDITIAGPDGPYPSWMEIERSGRGLVGSFVGRFGSARPVSRVTYQGGSVEWSVPPQWEDRKDDQKFEARFADEKLSGSTTDEKGRRLEWTAVRAPKLKRDKEPVWGKPIELFDGSTLSGWKPRHSSAKNGWSVQNGLLTNKPPSVDLVSEQKFMDFKLHAEFRYPRRSNSGIYLRGRYEMQIEDNYGQDPSSHGAGGIYGFLLPRWNAIKAAGEWQSVDVTLVGRRVSISVNGEPVIDRTEIPGITGGALDSNEDEPGPLMIQGDHGPIEFRKVTVTPAQ